MYQMLIFIVLSGIAMFAMMALETPAEGIAFEGGGDADLDNLDPAERAEMLGETPPAEPGPPETPPEETPPETPPAEEPPINWTDETQRQKEINRIIQERVKRQDESHAKTLEGIQAENRRLAKIVEGIAEGKVKPQEEGPQIPTTPDSVKDIGEYLGDETYAGWSMTELKAQHPDHYEHCKTRILNKIDVDSRFQTLEQRQATAEGEREYIGQLKGKIAKVKELMGPEKASDYFTPDGLLTAKFKTDYEDWGVQNGIIDPLLAYQLKDEAGAMKTHHYTDAEIQKIKDDAGNEAIKKLTGKVGGNDVPRVPSGGDQKPTGAVTAAMDSDTLIDIYTEGKTGSEEARKILKERGEL